jgi:hypothetical protein
MDRLCLFCEHFYFTGGESGYSEYTPGWGMDMYCTKTFDKKTMIGWEGEDSTQHTLLDNMFVAKICPYYEVDDYAKSLGAPE